MDVIRTPDERFDGLPGYPFAPHYVDVPRGDGSDGTLRVHVVDEGPRDATETVLLLHGEPSWSYLYRTMIPVITAAGFRAVAPDLVGFGRSDKPTERSDYTYQRHVDWMKAVIEALDLRHITLVCQDWGGLIGLRLVAEDPDRFARVVAANTFLPTGDTAARRRLPRLAAVLPGRPGLPDRRDREHGLDHRSRARRSSPPTTPRSPTTRYKAGARQFPMLVPTSPDDPASDAEPGRLDGPRAVDEAVPHRVLRRRPDHEGRRRRRCRRGSRARPASPTPRSRAAATSCRRTAGRSSRASSSTSSTQLQTAA